jgi:hypothetical protein
MRDDDGLQLDFMDVIDGISSLEGVRRRSLLIELGGASLRVASLADIIKSKKAAGLPMPRLTRKPGLETLKKESELALRDQIRGLLALPPEKRTHFLRKRIAWRMSAL